MEHRLFVGVGCDSSAALPHGPPLARSRLLATPDSILASLDRSHPAQIHVHFNLLPWRQVGPVVRVHDRDASVRAEVGAREPLHGLDESGDFPRFSSCPDTLVCTPIACVAIVVPPE